MQCSPHPLRRSWTSLLSKDYTWLPVGRSSSRSTSPNGQLLSQCRTASSKQWVSRQTTDRFAREAKVQGLKSRAAFKLLQINDKHRLFKPGMTVVDLGFAPGSWSQVAIEMTKPSGRVLGVDLLPAQPPKGVSTFQGDFTSPGIQADIISFLRDPDRGRLRCAQVFAEELITDDDLQEVEQSYIDKERQSSAGDGEDTDLNGHNDKVVDVVLSDMWEPWEPIEGHYKRSLSNPYFRMMNTSGNAFRDHTGSIDLCRSALYFSLNTLKIGGHFVCKFYQGSEDKAFEKSMKAMFHKVHREKPESSRKDSKEAYFIGLRRLAKVDREAVFADGTG